MLCPNPNLSHLNALSKTNAIAISSPATSRVRNLLYKQLQQNQNTGEESAVGGTKYLDVPSQYSIALIYALCWYFEAPILEHLGVPWNIRRWHMPVILLFVARYWKLCKLVTRAGNVRLHVSILYTVRSAACACVCGFGFESNSVRIPQWYVTVKAV
jgi:hypothetical protein